MSRGRVRVVVALVLLTSAWHASFPTSTAQGDEPGDEISTTATPAPHSFAVRQVDTPSAGERRYFGTAFTQYGREDRIIVGAPRHSSDNCKPGAAYVYERSTTGWTYKSTVASHGNFHHCGFGQSFTWSSRYLVVGAPEQPYQRGKADIFLDTWTLVPRTEHLETPWDAQSNGWSLAAMDSVVISGAPDIRHTYPNVADQDRIIWYLPNQGWQPQGSTFPPEWTTGDLFGYSLTVSGNNLFVGAPGRASAGSNDAGTVYHYVYEAPSFQLVRAIRPPIAHAGGQFGFAVAAYGNHLAVGEPGCLRNVTAGCVHRYQLDALDSTPHTWTTTSGRNGDRVGESLLFAHGLLFAGAPGVDSVNGWGAAGAVYAFETSPLTAHQAVEVLSPSMSNARFGASLWPTGDGVLTGAPHMSKSGHYGAGAFYALEFDRDSDGLSDRDEVKWQGTEPDNPDTDGDGLSDGQEVWVHKTDPLHLDSDRDRLDDGAEVMVWGTDPARPDTDGDRLPDGREVIDHRTDPHDFDSDDDGLGDGVEVDFYGSDPLDLDTDGDLFSDQYEVSTGSDPTDPWDVPIAGPFYQAPLEATPAHQTTDEWKPVI